MLKTFLSRGLSLDFTNSRQSVLCFLLVNDVLATTVGASAMVRTSSGSGMEAMFDKDGCLSLEREITRDHKYDM